MPGLIFPICPGYSFEGGPRYSTSVVSYGGGRELRNRNNAYPLHDFNVTATRKQDEIEQLVGFFHVCGGREQVFGFKDFGDFKSCSTASTISTSDQLIGTGTGARDRFPLIKTYESAGLTQIRPIAMPKDGTLLIAVGGVLVPGASFDADTFEVVFDSDDVPADGDEVTAGFEFYVPARFDTDQLQMVIENKRIASVSVPIVEVRL